MERVAKRKGRCFTLKSLLEIRHLLVRLPSPLGAVDVAKYVRRNPERFDQMRIMLVKYFC